MLVNYGLPARLVTPPAPEPGEAKELHPLWYLIEFLEGHSSFLRRTDPTDELAQVLSDSATLLKRLESPACLVVGGPHQGAPAPGENLATALGEADMDHVEQLAAIIRRVDGNNSMGAAALAEAILGRYPCAFLVDPLDTPPAPEPVAWCKSDEFANSMNRGGSFNGWKDPGAGANKCDMQLYAIPLPAPVPVAECPNCGYEGEMVQAPQAGEVGP